MAALLRWLQDVVALAVFGAILRGRMAGVDRKRTIKRWWEKMDNDATVLKHLVSLSRFFNLLVT
jgi:hypothetical protein